MTYDYELRREHLQREQAARDRRDAVRKPPRPPFQAGPHCPMCGESASTPPRPRLRWHPECAVTWQLTWTSEAIKILVDERGLKCEGCGSPVRHRSALEVDHRRPLWSLTDEERLDLRWWLRENLQLLCQGCHRTKTSREAGERAGRRRDVVLESAGQTQLLEEVT